MFGCATINLSWDAIAGPRRAYHVCLRQPCHFFTCAAKKKTMPKLPRQITCPKFVSGVAHGKGPRQYNSEIIALDIAVYMFASCPASWGPSAHDAHPEFDQVKRVTFPV